MSMNKELISVVGLMGTDPEYKRAFTALTSSMALSGWEIVRDAKLSPDKAKEVLAKFIVSGVVQSKGSGLTGYYAPTGDGFLLKENFPELSK